MCSKKVEQYRGDESRVIAPLDGEEVLSGTIALDEPIIVTMQAWSTKGLRSKMTKDGLFIARKRFKIHGKVGLRVSGIESPADNPPTIRHNY